MRSTSHLHLLIFYYVKLTNLTCLDLFAVICGRRVSGTRRLVPEPSNYPVHAGAWHLLTGGNELSGTNYLVNVLRIKDVIA